MPDAHAWRFANFAGSTSTSTTASTEVVAAVAGHRIRVKGLFLNVSAAAVTNLAFHSAAVNISGDLDLASGDEFILPLAPADSQTGWFQTAVGAALNLSQTNGGTAAIIGGAVVYTVVP
jgi:hypothetical protein